MIGKSTKYKCGGKVHKKNKGGKMKLSKTPPPLGNNPQAGQENRKPREKKPKTYGDNNEYTFGDREPITPSPIKKRKQRLGYSGYNKGGATCCSNLADKAAMYRGEKV